MRREKPSRPSPLGSSSSTPGGGILRLGDVVGSAQTADGRAQLRAEGVVAALEWMRSGED